MVLFGFGNVLLHKSQWWPMYLKENGVIEAQGVEFLSTFSVQNIMWNEIPISFPNFKYVLSLIIVPAAILTET